MATLFAMPPAPGPQPLGTRSYIYASQPEVQVLNSSTAEARLRFLNSAVDANTGYVLSASNAQFFVLSGSNTVSAFGYDAATGLASQSVQGYVSGQRFTVDPPGLGGGTAPRRGFVAYDVDPLSTENFGGLGYGPLGIQYQAPYANGHAFLVAADSFHSTPVMVAQQNTVSGVAQVGIGTVAPASNAALHVSGITLIDGDLQISGKLQVSTAGIEATLASYVQYDSNTQRVPESALPSGLVYVNSNTNLIDNSVLPQAPANNNQYVRWNQNVGIGTRNAVQKLQVSGGSAAISDRIGIGTVYPAARVHAIESSAGIPSAIVENNAGGDLLWANANGARAATLTGTGALVLGPSPPASASTMLDVQGDAVIHGKLVASNLTFDGNISVSTLNVSGVGYTALTQQTQVASDGTLDVVMASYVPFQFQAGISTSNITTAGSAQLVHFQNCGVQVDGTVFLATQPVITSDRRMKSALAPITGALDRIEQLHGYTYTARGTGRRHAGLIAQEVRQALPEAVASLPDGGAVGAGVAGAGGPLLGVSYDSVLALLVEAVRDLRGQVQRLEARLG